MHHPPVLSFRSVPWPRCYWTHTTERWTAFRCGTGAGLTVFFVGACCRCGSLLAFWDDQLCTSRSRAGVEPIEPICGQLPSFVAVAGVLSSEQPLRKVSDFLLCRIVVIIPTFTQSPDRSMWSWQHYQPRMPLPYSSMPLNVATAMNAAAWSTLGQKLKLKTVAQQATSKKDSVGLARLTLFKYHGHTVMWMNDLLSGSLSASTWRTGVH